MGENKSCKSRKNKKNAKAETNHRVKSIFSTSCMLDRSCDKTVVTHALSGWPPPLLRLSLVLSTMKPCQYPLGHPKTLRRHQRRTFIPILPHYFKVSFRLSLQTLTMIPYTPSSAQTYANMTRAHYIVRIGNVGLAQTISQRAPNHWHYLSSQRLWGLPKGMNHVKVRAEFMANMENPRVTAYIWFLCNGHGGPGHFVQVGIGRHHLGEGPVGNGNIPIPEEMMVRLRQGFDHWFEWRPVNPDAAFQDRVRQLPIPYPHFIPTLRRVTVDHPSFPLFEALIDSEEPPAGVVTTALPAVSSIVPALEVDLENIRREQAEPHSQGYVYLIHMRTTTFYKIGMSHDPVTRLQTLQTGNPRALYLINVKAVQDMRSAEMALHRRFETHRVPDVHTREWFDLNDEDEVQLAFATIQ